MQISTVGKGDGLGSGRNTGFGSTRGHAHAMMALEGAPVFVSSPRKCICNRSRAFETVLAALVASAGFALFGLALPSGDGDP